MTTAVATYPMLSNPLSCIWPVNVKSPLSFMTTLSQPPSGSSVTNGPESKETTLFVDIASRNELVPNVFIKARIEIGGLKHNY